MVDNTKNDNEPIEGVEVSPLEVHMLDLEVKNSLEKIMSTNIVRGAGTLLVLGLGLMFGIMFLIGSIGLLKGKSSPDDVAAVESVEGEAAAEGEAGDAAEEDATEEE